LFRLNQDDTGGRVTLWKKLDKKMKSAVGLDTCALSESGNGQKQFIVAVAGQNSSVEIITLNFAPQTGFSTFKPYTVLEDVHSGPLTRLVFSNFIGPPEPVSKDRPLQSALLASVGVDQTVVVHKFLLRPYSPVKSTKPGYFLVVPGSKFSETTQSIVAAIIVCAIAVFLTQVFCEVRGAVPPTLGSPNWLSDSLRNKFHIPYIPLEDRFSTASSHPTVPPTDSASAALSSHIAAIIDAPSVIPIPPRSSDDIPTPIPIEALLSDAILSNAALDNPAAIVVRADQGEISAELHHDTSTDAVIEKVEEQLTKWEDLNEKQKRSWKQKLVDAGHWAEQQGESVLKGILFSELAALAA
jgi:glycyl-tRNA synthetase